MSDTKKVGEHAEQVFRSGFVCSQAVLSAFAGEYGLGDEQALRVAAPFGGGMGCLGHTCGAVNGALLALGLRFGRTRLEDLHAKQTTNQMVQEFCRRFTEGHGSLQCRELLGVDISTPEGHARAKEQNLFREVCPVFVRSAAEIVAGLV